MAFYFLAAFALSFIIADYGSRRTIGYWPSFFISFIFSPLVGLFVVFLSEKNQAKHRFKEAFELAKKEEFKGNNALALNSYKDCLYHLQNDYKHLPKKQVKAHQEFINTVQNKINELET